MVCPNPHIFDGRIDGRAKTEMMGKQLVAIELKKLPAGMHADGAGLYLEVKQSGSRSWTPI